MRFQALLQYLHNYFHNKFDFDTIERITDDPYVHIQIIKNLDKPSTQGYSFYLTRPLHTSIFPASSRLKNVAVMALTSKYLLQNHHRFEFLDQCGCSYGFEKQNSTYLCTVIANPDDAKFICKSVITQMKIFVNSDSLL